MALGVVLLMLIILVIVVAVCKRSPHVAYRVLQQSQNLFEPDDQALVPPKERAVRVPPMRGYV